MNAKIHKDISTSSAPVTENTPTPSYEKLLLFLGVLIPFSFALSPTDTIDLNILKILIPVIFIFWLAHSLLRKKILIDTRLRFWLLISFLFITISSSFWTTAPESAFRKILFFISTLPLYFVFYSAQSSTKFLNSFLRQLLFGSFLVASLAIIFFLLQFIIGLNPTLNILREFSAPLFLGQSMTELVNQYSSWLVNISGKTILRTFGTFPDPHLFSLYLSMVFPIGLYLYFSTKNKLFLLFSLTILIATLLSFSRAAYLSLLIGFIFIALTNNFSTLLKKNILLLYTLFTFLIFLLIIPNPLASRFQSSFNSHDGSNIGRIEMWQTAVQYIQQNSLTGLGLGGFADALNNSLGIRNPIYAHNLLLDFGAETGLLNMLILFALLIAPVITYLKTKHAYSKNSLHQFITISFVIFFIHSLFETPFFSIRVFPLFLILLAIDFSKN